MTDSLKHRASVIDSLGSSLRRGGTSLEMVPGLLKRVLEEDAWREFETSLGDVVRHERFTDFVTTPPTKGLGASMELIDRIVGTGDPDLLRMLREAKKGKPGRRPSGDIGVDSTPNSKGDHDTEATAERLARDAPEEYEAVRRGEKTIHAAAVAAGLRRRRVPVRLDSAESAAKTLRKHMSPDARQALARLLLEEEAAE